MILNFSSKTAQHIYDGDDSRYARKLPKNLHAKARRLLDQVNAATRVETLKVPPGNRLEPLKGDYKGFWSIRINDQWRVIFRFNQGTAYDVDMLDYH